MSQSEHDVHNSIPLPSARRSTGDEAESRSLRMTRKLALATLRFVSGYASSLWRRTHSYHHPHPHHLLLDSLGAHSHIRWPRCAADWRPRAAPRCATSATRVCWPARAPCGGTKASRVRAPRRARSQAEGLTLRGGSFAGFYRGFWAHWGSLAAQAVWLLAAYGLIHVENYLFPEEDDEYEYYFARPS